jgi:peptide chain release factor-like protein
LILLISVALHTASAAQTPASDPAARTGSLRQIIPGHYVHTTNNEGRLFNSGVVATFGRDRETINVGYAGDIIGLVNPGQFAIGDTVHTGEPLKFMEVPRFPAEHFGRVRLKDQRYKQFDEGLKQLDEEGLMQVFFTSAGRREPVVGVVGALQPDVIVSRLQREYSVEVEIGGGASVLPTEASGHRALRRVTRGGAGAPVALPEDRHAPSAAPANILSLKGAWPPFRTLMQCRRKLR